MTFQTTLRLLLKILVALPAEILAGIWRLVLILLLAILSLLRFLWCLLLRLFGRSCEERGEREKCLEIPQHIKRKPDPCLYSQFYLISLGYSVTWDNPDIVITLPDGTAVNSYQLLPDTDYLVRAQIHDASFDPALATEVRCFYRPWSFNSPDRIPVEVNPDGTEKVVVLHIPPWDLRIAEFKWHTPDTPGTHYCLQVECRHPDDSNPNNNLGQENTQIIDAAPNAAFQTEALLANPLERARIIRVFADQYRIGEGDIQLTLAKRVLPMRRRANFDAIHRLMVTRDAAAGRLKTQGSYGPVWTAYAYKGFQQLREKNRRGTAPLDPAWRVKVHGREMSDGFAEIELAAKQQLMVPITAQVPGNAAPGQQHNLNFSAYSEAGKLLGGVTLKIKVKT